MPWDLLAEETTASLAVDARGIASRHSPEQTSSGSKVQVHPNGVHPPTACTSPPAPRVQSKVSTPCVRHVRWPVEVVLDMVASGMKIDEILADHPELEREDVIACLEYAHLLVSGEPARQVA